MNLTIQQDALAKALSIVGKAVESRPTLPVLSHVLVRADEEPSALHISGTDLEIRIDANVSANVVEGGALTVPARLFTDLVNSLPANGSVVRLTSLAGKDDLRIEQDKLEAALRGISADEFPMPPSVIENGERVATFEPWDLRERLAQVVMAAAKDEGQPTLTGVFFERKEGVLSLVTADGFRLALRKDDVSEGDDWTAIVPAKPLVELVKMLKDETEDVSLWRGGDTIVAFRLARLTLMTQLIEGTYVNYRQIIPTRHDTSAIVDRIELMKALKTAALFSDYSVCFTFGDPDSLHTPGVLKLHAEHVELGNFDVTLNVQMEGEPVDVALDAQYALDVLKVIDTDEVEFEMGGSTRPVVVKPVGKTDVDGKYTHVIMPMHVRES